MKKILISTLIISSLIFSTAHSMEPIEYCQLFISKLHLTRRLPAAIVEDYRTYLFKALGYTSNVPLYKDYAKVIEAFDEKKIKIKVLERLGNYDAYECIIYIPYAYVVYNIETYRQCKKDIGKYCEDATREFVNSNYYLYYNGWIDRDGDFIQGVSFIKDINGNIMY